MPQKRRKKKDNFSRLFLFRGSATISLIIIIIIIGAALLSGGIFPKEPQLTSPPQEAIPDITAPSPGGKKSLQLETIKFKACAELAAVDFLVDNSGSMRFVNKMPELKKGMSTFSNNFPDSGVVGIQIYSDPDTYPPLGYRELLPVSKFGDIKNKFNSIVNSMIASGGTHSRDAMAFAKERLEKAKEKFGGYKFNLIFISDGIPETLATNTACPGGPTGNLCTFGSTGGCRCFAEEQNPTSVANEIKGLGVRIFTIAYVDTQDAKFNDRLQELMRNVASTPSDYYQAPVESQLTGILSQISEKLCK